MLQTKRLFIILAALIGMTLGLSSTLIAPSSVYAESPSFGCAGGPVGPGASSTCPYTASQVQQFCAHPSTIPEGDTIHCPTGTGGSQAVTNDSQAVVRQNVDGNREADCLDENPNAQNCGVISYLVTFIKVLTGIVGVVIVIMIAVGGIQYSAARDNPQSTVAAKGRIINALIALVFYMFSFAILQWLVPGGIL